ncbi:uncharacterized protein OCT59_015688 [Rhizophagus irregularis]|uniref:uncharacterized protein n=1 Tax=Rhizophagus irregularis TaxID=588596 RepID=UPI000CBF911B|nr:hypothetical protein OCT59_015688 [Rhizophagus irregularis]GBC49404.1 hypothetical protein RIR_jg42520.t1 [Rhizophagus irregularis DAOM 181602=DAOM 197198]
MNKKLLARKKLQIKIPYSRCINQQFGKCKNEQIILDFESLEFEFKKYKVGKLQLQTKKKFLKNRKYWQSGITCI